MISLAYRPFVDPLNTLFAGIGWLSFLPLVVFASAFAYHALRAGDAAPLGLVCRRAGWLSCKVLAVLGALMAVLWLT